ncbi:MAG: hypothetical protein MMC23_002310 [Stictis urceolatum]|nr:hypothetical protein [Stictis urceolata]
MVVLPDPLAILASIDDQFEDAATLKGFVDYWSTVAPQLQQLLLSYLNGAFKAMGVSLNTLPQGSPIPPLKHLPKHERVVKRLFEILEEAQCVSYRDSKYVRHTASLPSESASPQLLASFVADRPRFAVDARMMALTGPQLGDCLTGKVDPRSLLFGDRAASKVLADFYLHSPIFATLTEHMISLLGPLLNGMDSGADNPLKIFEVGAGLGGTTSRLIEFIQAMGFPVEYTFTDISQSLVAKAGVKYKAHADWMRFMPFDMEKPVSETLRGRYDIVIATMAVHATSSRSQSCSALYELLANGGFMMLSEGTQRIDWYDITFGLLEGWWLSADYPLQPAEVWMQEFKKIGFQECGYSSGPSREANTQQLLLARKKIKK